MITAFFAAIFGGAGDIINKTILGRMKMGIKNYLPLVFLLLTLVTLIFLPINFYFNHDAFLFWNIVVFVIMLASAGVWNVMLAKSLETEPLHEYEVIVLMSPFITVVLAAIFFSSERHIIAFLAGLISSAVLIISRFNKDHLVISRTAKMTLFAVFLIAVESICIKWLLNFYSPALLYFIRVLILTIIFMAFYRPDFSILKNAKNFNLILISAILGAGVMILRYYAFGSIGLVPTTIIMLLSPLFTYIASYYYFNEKKNFKKDLICAVVIIACIMISLIHK